MFESSRDIQKLRLLKPESFPLCLREIPQPPKQLYVEGVLPSEDLIHLAVVGSRKNTPYGKQACQNLIEGLKGYPIVIVSGLALGIDTIAHESALRAGLITMAIPGSGLAHKVLYPATNRSLAEKIIKSGGCLVSEFEPEFKATLWSFPARNRLMAGMARAVLIIEAEEKSGTLITARMATDYNRDVLAVPNSIFSQTSQGTNKLIKLGATPITSSADILEALGLAEKEQTIVQQELFDELPDEEKSILIILREPKSRDEVIREIGKPASETNMLLSIMEIKGLIKEEMGELYRVV